MHHVSLPTDDVPSYHSAASFRSYVTPSERFSNHILSISCFIYFIFATSSVSIPEIDEKVNRPRAVPTSVRKLHITVGSEAGK
jgi:hypothetical protein